MPTKSGRSGSADNGAVAAPASQSVSTFMKPASILFILAALAIGGVIILFVKFRSMDAQVRKLTEQVATVPTEEDVKALNEEWAVEFNKKQAEQHTLLMEQMQNLQQVADATRAHLVRLESGDVEPVCLTGECPLAQPEDEEKEEEEDDDDNDMPSPNTSNVLPAPTVSIALPHEPNTLSRARTIPIPAEEVPEEPVEEVPEEPVPEEVPEEPVPEEVPEEPVPEEELEESGDLESSLDLDAGGSESDMDE